MGVSAETSPRDSQGVMPDPQRQHTIVLREAGATAVCAHWRRLFLTRYHFSAVVYGHVRHAQGLEFPHLAGGRPPPLLPGAAGPPAGGRRRTASPSRQAADRRAAGVLGPPPPRRTATRPCLLNGPERVRHTRSTHHCRACVFAVRLSLGWYMSAAAHMHEAVYRCGRCHCRQASWATAAWYCPFDVQDVFRR